MASKKTQTQSLVRYFSSLYSLVPSGTKRSNIPPNPGDNSVLSRFFSRKAGGRPEMSQAMNYPSSIVENMSERFRLMGIAKDWIRLDGLSSPPANSVAAVTARSDTAEVEGLTMEDVRKLLKAAKLETIKSRVRIIEKSWIWYPEFIRICGEGYSDPDQGRQFAKMLDESGDVVVLGNVVFLRPEQITKAMEGLMAVAEVNPEWDKELEEMANKKSAIDAQAEALVRRELWCGLGFLLAQTAAFMRLTFWELSWDVMEPICFYLTSTYFMAAYVFFLRTSIEPSFQGFYQTRFVAKQKGLMKLHGFDIVKYNELRRRSYHHHRPRFSLPSLSTPSSSTLFDQSENIRISALHHETDDREKSFGKSIRQFL